MLAVVLAVQVGDDPRDDARRSHLVGKVAPAFALPALDGSRLRSADSRETSSSSTSGTPGASRATRSTMPWSSSTSRHADEPGFAMVGIVRDDTDDAIRQYVDAEDVTYPVAFDPGIARRARLRHEGPARDLRDRARRCDRRPPSTVPRRSRSSSRCIAWPREAP